MNLTRVENQTILTEVTRFNLSEQIRGAVLLLAEKWTPKNLYMDMQFGEHMICANEELLKQVWINLLDNAIKFSDPNGTVSVDISDGSECLSISVSNHAKTSQRTVLPISSISSIRRMSHIRRKETALVLPS